MDHVGWRRGGSDEGQHGSAKKRRGSLHCLVEEWWDCEETKAEAEKVGVCGQDMEAKETPCGAVRGHVQIPLHEMRQKHQEDEDAREM